MVKLLMGLLPVLASRAARQGDRAKLPQGREVRPARRARRPTTGRAGAPAATCPGHGEGIRSPCADSRAREARARRRPSPEARFSRRPGPCPGWAASGGVVTGIDTTKGEVPCHHAIRVRYPCALLAAPLLCPVATQAQTMPFFPKASSVPWTPRATNSGSDWIGYVYPNTNGNVPVIN